MMKALIATDSLYIKGASPRLKDDKAFALYAIEQETLCWNYLSLRLKADKDLINTIFDKGYFPLEDDVLAAYRNDLKTIRRAVSVDRKNLSKASVTVRRNKAFVMSLIKQYKDSDILRMAVPSLWEDFELQALILEFNPEYIMHCTDEVRNNKDLMLRTVKKWPSAYLAVGEALRDDIRFLLALIQDDDQIFHRLQDFFRGTRPFVRRVCDIIIGYKILPELQSIKVLLEEGYCFVPQVLKWKQVIMFYSPEGDRIISDKPSSWKAPYLVNTPEIEMPPALAERLDFRFWAQKTPFNPFKVEKSTTDAEDESTALSHSFSMLGGA